MQSEIFAHSSTFSEEKVTLSSCLAQCFNFRCTTTLSPPPLPLPTSWASRNSRSASHRQPSQTVNRVVGFQSFWLSSTYGPSFLRPVIFKVKMGMKLQKTSKGSILTVDPRRILAVFLKWQAIHPLNGATLEYPDTVVNIILRICFYRTANAQNKSPYY